MGVFKERELTLRELENIVKEGNIEVQVDSPEGWAPVTHFFNNGVKECLRINDKLEVSTDHPMDALGLPPRTEASVLKVGDVLLHRDGLKEINSIEDIGEQEVCDLSVAHMEEGHHRFFSEGYSIYNCLTCGKCLHEDMEVDVEIEYVGKNNSNIQFLECNKCKK